MKIKCAIIVCLTVLLFSGCALANANDAAGTSERSKDTSTGSQKEETKEVSGSSEIFDDSDIISDPAPVVAGTVDELIEAIRESKTAAEIDAQAKIAGLNTIESLYVPTAEIDGFELRFIEVNKSFIFYYYLPESVDASDTLYVDLDRDIEITFLRGNYDDPMSIPEEQFHESPNEDGIIYLPYMRNLFAPVGDTIMTVRVPESLNNYEYMKSLCKAELIEIG